ncbi:MAG: AAC(3) family N-acetyltransferase [Candidatus Merdivicinus sp.]
MEFQKEDGRIFYKEGRTVLAEITFPETFPGIREIQHTYVAESMRGQGIASQLVATAALEIAAEGYKAKASCEYAAKWLKCHPETAASLSWQKKELQEQLKRMGILPSDTVMIHSSLRTVGPVEDGANGLIEALRDYLRDGLLLIPTHTWADVNAENPYFDASASIPCIGVLPQVAAFHPDGVRSLHPTHSITAFGRRAAEYVRGEEKAATPAPPNGCWGRLYEENAKILLVGVSQNRNTYLHSVEEMLNIPDRLDEQAYLVHGTDGKGFCWEQPMHSHCCSLTKDISQFYPKYLPSFEKYGAVTIGQLGSARTEICSARRCADILRQIWQRADGEIGVGHEPLDPALYENLQ